MQELVDRFRDVLEARGYSEATCDAYVRCVRKLLRHTGKHADEVTPEDVTSYLLWLRREAKLAPMDTEGGRCTEPRRGTCFGGCAMTSGWRCASR